MFLVNCLDKKEKVEIWVNEKKDIKYQGIINGLDEFMNLTINECIEM